MKKILFLCLLAFVPTFSFAESELGGAIHRFIEKSKRCDEIKLQIAEIEKQEVVDEAKLQALKSEFTETKCSIDDDSNNENVVEEPVTEEPVSNEPLKCEDGTLPDEHGCCTGETFKQMDDGMKACCPETGDCFPPMYN